MKSFRIIIMVGCVIGIILYLAPSPFKTSIISNDNETIVQIGSDVSMEDLQLIAKKAKENNMIFNFNESEFENNKITNLRVYIETPNQKNKGSINFNQPYFLKWIPFGFKVSKTDSSGSIFVGPTFKTS